jgi:hypothetical protein
MTHLTLVAEEQDVKKLTVGEFRELISKEKENGLSFEEIEKRFKQQGYVSKRTEKPLTKNTIRIYYYRPDVAQGVVDKIESDTQSEAKLAMIDKILDKNAKPEAKLELIEMIVRQM